MARDEGTQGRTILVLDAADRPVPGAEILEGDCGFDAYGRRHDADRLGITAADGRALLRAFDPAAGITVCAPGHGIEHVEAPPAEAAWIVRLPGAHRLELVLLGTSDVRGMHVDVALPATFQTRAFYSGKYVQAPGRSVGGAPAEWQEHRDGSQWTLAFTEGGVAALDQLADAGRVHITLRRFAEALDQREVDVEPDGGTTRVELTAPALPAPLRGRTVDPAGRPVAEVRVCMVARDGLVTLDSHLPMAEPFPRWAPFTRSDAAGRFEIPRPSDTAERVVFRREGHADRVLTIGELEALRGEVVLSPGRAVRLEFVDRAGEALDGGWTTIGRFFAEPRALLAHDVWRAASRSDHPAGGGVPCELPCFLFADLPEGLVTFGCDELPSDEVFVHDTRDPGARFETAELVGQLGLGK